MLVDEVQSDCHMSRAPGELVLGCECDGCGVVDHENGRLVLCEAEFCKETAEPDDLAQGELDRFDLRVGRRERDSGVSSGAGTDGAAREVKKEREAELGLGVAVLDVRCVGHAPQADLVIRWTLRESYAVVRVISRQILVDASDGGEMATVGARGEAREDRQGSEERWDSLVREEAKFADLGQEGAGPVGQQLVEVHGGGHRNVADRRRIRREARGRDLRDVWGLSQLHCAVGAVVNDVHTDVTP